MSWGASAAEALTSLVARLYLSGVLAPDQFKVNLYWEIRLQIKLQVNIFGEETGVWSSFIWKCDHTWLFWGFLSVHKILNQVYIQTSLATALGDEINKLSSSLPKTQRWAGTKNSLPTPQHNTLCQSSSSHGHHNISLGNYTRASSNTVYNFVPKNHIYIAHLNFILMDNWLWTVFFLADHYYLSFFIVNYFEYKKIYTKIRDDIC